MLFATCSRDAKYMLRVSPLGTVLFERGHPNLMYLSFTRSTPSCSGCLSVFPIDMLLSRQPFHRDTTMWRSTDIYHWPILEANIAGLLCVPRFCHSDNMIRSRTGFARYLMDEPRNSLKRGKLLSTRRQMTRKRGVRAYIC